MPRFSANLSTVFVEHPFLDRFEAAAKAGFTHVEAQFPHEHATAAEVARALSDSGLTMVSINTAKGDTLGFATGEDEARFDDSVEAAVDYARTIGCGAVHVLTGNRPAKASVVERLGHAADRLARSGLTMLIEPMNRVERPDYWLDSLEKADDVLEALRRPNLKILFDFWHTASNGVEPHAALAQRLDRVGHIQLGAARDRGEPEPADRMDDLFAFLDSSGWDGFVGLEYTPRGDTVEGLAWLGNLLPRASGEEIQCPPLRKR